MTTCSEYLDRIEETLGEQSRNRHAKFQELTSIDELAVDSIVSGYYTADSPDAYLRALAMALVRTERRELGNLFQL